jgi:hypothetical protein
MQMGSPVYADQMQICIGKHITNTEMYKLIPTILRDYEFDMHLNGAKEWKTTASWFQTQKDVWCSVRRRRAREGNEVVDFGRKGE